MVMKSNPYGQWEVLNCQYQPQDCNYRVTVGRYPLQSKDKIDPYTRVVYFPNKLRVGELVTISK